MESLVPEEAAALTRLVRIVGEPIPQISTVNEDGFGCFVKDRHLIQLHLYDKHLKRIPREIFQFPQLEMLNLAGNELIKIPDQIETLTKLAFLNVSYNHITAISESLCEISSLHSLLMRSNAIREIPFSINHLQSLDTFNVAVNQITEIPTSLFKCTQLRVLDLSNNKLTQLPPDIGNLNYLQILHLRGNLLTELPEAMNNLHDLQSLDLRGNPWDYFFDKFLLKLPIRRKIENIARFASFIPSLTEKIINNLPLDEFDKAYPYYLRYESVIRRTCQQFYTRTSEEVEKILDDGKYVSQKNDYKIFL